MKIDAATLAGGDVNQDRYLVGPNFAAVLDGASSFGDNPSEYDGGWYAEQLASRLKALLTERPESDTADLVADAITDIRDTYSLDPATSPTSTLALVRWNDETIECYCLGDSSIVLIHKDGTETVVTDDRIKQFGAELREKYRTDLRAGGGFGERHRATLAALQAEQAKHRNIEGGYWIVGAEPGAAHHAISGITARGLLTGVVIHSDGLRRGIPLTRRQILKKRVLRDIWQILAQQQEGESEDPRGSLEPRAKAHDDKTLVVITLPK